MPISTNTKIRLTMTCLSGFSALYSRWVPLTNFIAPHRECISTDLKLPNNFYSCIQEETAVGCPCIARNIWKFQLTYADVNLNGSERQSPSRGQCSLQWPILGGSARKGSYLFQVSVIQKGSEICHCDLKGPKRANRRFSWL